MSQRIAPRRDLARLGREFSKNRMIVVPGFLSPEFAERVHRAITLLDDRFWYEYRATPKQKAVFGERQAVGHYLLYPITGHEQNPLTRRRLASGNPAAELGSGHPLIQLQEALNSRGTQALIEDIASVSLSRRSCICFASRFRPGDYLTPHTDGSFPRRVAFVLYMTKGWKPGWGGKFIRRGSASPVVPEFNSLLLFEVPVSHRVSRVSARAASHPGGRQAITGWFHDYSKAHLLAEARSKRRIPPIILKQAAG